MANKFNDKKIKESTAMIHKITAALMKNLEQYKAAKAKGDDTKKFVKTSKQLIDAKKKWQDELESQIMQMDKGVELAMTESKLFKGYDDPSFPKAKYHAASKAMEQFAKSLKMMEISREAIEGMFSSMGKRMAKLYGTK